MTGTLRLLFLVVTSFFLLLLLWNDRSFYYKFNYGVNKVAKHFNPFRIVEIRSQKNRNFTSIIFTDVVSEQKSQFTLFYMSSCIKHCVGYLQSITFNYFSFTFITVKPIQKLFLVSLICWQRLILQGQENRNSYTSSRVLTYYNNTVGLKHWIGRKGMLDGSFPRPRMYVFYEELT